MEVVSLASLRVGSLVWHDERVGPTLTVVCKGTYRLLPGASEALDEQEPLYGRDEHEDGDEARSLYAASDLVPRKPRADVVLVGHAYAPRGEAVRALVARVSIGVVDKEIEVVGDRAWTREGAPGEPGRFARMPLSYERAAGGPGTSNPLGVPAGAERLPNLQPPGAAPSSRREPIPPVGFGPVPASHPDRRARLGKHAPGRSPARLFDGPLPEGFDHGYFNAAPPDQQLPVLRDGERLVLHNLHRDHERLLTVLPAARPRAVVERPGAPPLEVGLRCDTLWIDTDRAICTLTWRGQLPLASRDEPGRVLVALEQPGARLSQSDVIAIVGPLSAPSAGPDSAPPISIEPDDDEPSTVSFVEPPLPPATPMMGGLRLASSRPSDPGTADGSSSFLAAAPITALGPSPSPDPPAGAAAAEPVPPVKASSRPRVRTLMTVPGAAPAGPTWRASVAGGAPSSRPRSGSPPPAAAKAPAAAPRAGEAIDLIWADPSSAPRMRRAFGDLLADLPPAAQADPEAAAMRVLASGAPRDAAALDDVMGSAIGPDAGFRPPAVLVAGELRFAFDEIETLRAVVGAARPFAAGDAALGAALDEARAVLATPAAPGGLCERLARRVRDVFEGAARPVPPGFLDAEVERTLLARRAYERRALFGGERLCARVTLPGAEAACPVYLPDALAKVLPMFPVFEAKVVAEAHAAQDPAEAHPVALHALALGRVVAQRRGTG